MPVSDLLKAVWQGDIYIQIFMHIYFALRHISYKNIKFTHIHGIFESIILVIKIFKGRI
jgi:hypothetical protein